MDKEQLKSEFLEEIIAPLNLFLSEIRQRMGNMLDVKTFDKRGLMKHVLDEFSRIVHHYNAAKLDKTYMSKVIEVVKPVIQFAYETKLVDMEAVLVDIIKKLQTEMGVKNEPLAFNEDDIVEFRDKLWDVFSHYPVDDFQQLTNSMSGNIDPNKEFQVKAKVVRHLAKSYNKETDGTFNEYIKSELEALFNYLWNETFEKLAIEELKKERMGNSKAIADMHESLRKAMLKQLMG